MATGDSSDFPDLTDKPRKRKVAGSAKDKAKQQRVSSHVTGEDSMCTRFKCFEMVTPMERQKLIADFNVKYCSKDQQDAYLSTLIKMFPVKRRRPRGGTLETNENPHNHSNRYCVKTRNDEHSDVQEKMVCHKAFLSLFGITAQRVETIRKALVKTGLLLCTLFIFMMIIQRLARNMGLLSHKPVFTIVTF